MAVSAEARATARAVLRRYGRTFAEELGIDVARNTPSPLFRLLCFALLSSTRIGHALALRAARALADNGWTTPRRILEATWAERTRVLNRAGYARYDESTSRMLGDTSTLLLDRYGGDLRRLREQAGRDVPTERRLLTEFKGIGDVGADIFFREVQVAWGEVFAFVDARAGKAAGKLRLPRDANELRALVRGRREFTRLVTGLVRVELEKGYEGVRGAVA